jgi:hypothetical protein
MFYLALLAFAAKKVGTPRLLGVARVTAYAGGISILLGAVGIHKARAALNEKGMEFGEDMMSLSSMLKDPHTFRLNGQAVHTSTATTLEGINSVLDKYEANCESSLGGNAPVWEGIPDTSKGPPKDAKPLSVMPIMRQSVGNKGMIACFLPNDPLAPHSERALQEAIHDFEETGNLSAVGRFRYAYVKESATGSTVFTVWTDGDFSLKALMPPRGQDAQGTDPVVMMRPTKSERIFTGTVDGIGYRVYGYRTKESPKEAIDAYDAQMEGAGWLSVTNPIFEGMPHEGNEGRSFINQAQGFAGVASAIKTPEGDTMIGIAEVSDGVVHPPTQQPKDSDGF